MKKDQEFKFEILDTVEQNRFFDSTKAQNGGGYHQPLITFTFNGKTGSISDTSCGDFGKRIHIEFGDKYYWLSTMTEYQEESTFSESEDMLLSEYLKFIGYPITFAEELERAFIKTKKYELYESKTEVDYKDESQLGEGISQERDPEPELIEIFTHVHEALEALRKHQTEVHLMKGTTKYYHVTEFYVEEAYYNQDGEWVDGGDIIEFSEFPEIEN